MTFICSPKIGRPPRGHEAKIKVYQPTGTPYFFCRQVKQNNLLWAASSQIFSQVGSKVL